MDDDFNSEEEIGPIEPRKKNSLLGLASITVMKASSREDRIHSNKPFLEESLDGSAEDAFLFDFKANRRISPGHKIRMETDDPVNRPLPSVTLLQLQWTLQRLAALSGAAEAIDVLLDSDDEENDDMVRL